MPEIVEKGFAERQKPVGSPSHSKILMSPTLSGTYRFGEISPFFCMEGVADDVIELACKHKLRSYTLEAPLMSDIQMNRDLFMIPFEAILPRTWDIVFKQPKVGDDVPSDAMCNFKVDQFGRAFIQACYNDIESEIDKDSPSYARILDVSFKAFNMIQLIYSRGSLLSAMGCNLWPRFDESDYYTEQFFGTLEGFLDGVGHSFELRDEDSSKVLNVVAAPVQSDEVSLRQAWQLMYDDPTWHITKITASSADIIALGSYLEGLLDSIIAWFSGAVNVGDETLDCAPLLAYQIAVAHYFSNDNVDYVWSANLYRSYIGSLIKAAAADASDEASFFEYNGEYIQYDYLSGYCFNLMLSFVQDFSSGWTDISDMYLAYSYAYALFGFRRSLRFMDYFTGGRVRPLAVGDISIDTSSGSVSALDVSRGIVRARLANVINRLESGFKGYIRGLFGVDKVAPDYHDPFRLAQMKDSVFGDEVDNTGAAQLSQKVSTTTTLRSTGSKYVFRIDVDRPCILLGVVWFDLPRSYSRGIDKFFLHRNRFDMFNPYLQYLGDQPILRKELNSIRVNESEYFGYTNRHQEYKTIPNRAFGGFISGALPSWEFIADKSFQDIQNYPLSPEYIRSRPSELDSFYIALSGYSVANYFHFAIKWQNEIDSNRPMILAPNIL